MDNFLRVSFKYRENPFEYENITPKNGAINGAINLTDDEQVIFHLIIENAKISQKEISEKSKIPYRTVQRLVASLKNKNIIKRIGSNKSGYWEIIEK